MAKAQLPKMHRDIYELHCREQFACINVKLDRIDLAIRGNGGPGIKARIGRLELADRWRRRITWTMGAAALAIIVKTAVEAILAGWPA